jgi:hypothetical protein
VTSITQIRTALAATLNTVPGLSATANYQSQVNPPMAIVLPQTGQIITFDTFDNGDTYYLRVILIVSYGEDISSQAALDAYLDPTGSNSVIGALHADPSLGGVVSFCVPTTAVGYGLVEWAGNQYFGTTLTVTVATK